VTRQQLLRAVYYALVLWIPVETVIFLRSDAESTVSLSRLLGVVLFGLALFARRTCFRRIPAEFWMMAWYAAILSLSQLWIPSELDGFFRAQQLTLFQMLALFLISVNLFADRGFRENLPRVYGRWISVVAAGMVLGAAGGWIESMEGRSNIADLDPNVTAGFFALGAVCIAGDPRVFKANGFALRAGLSVAAVAILILAILQTGSRGGMLVFVAGLLALLACGGKASRGSRFMITSAVVVLLGFMIFLEFQKGTAAAMRMDQAVRNGDTAGRTRIWKAALAMFLEKPLLGYGAGNNVYTLGGHLNRVWRDTHNLFLAVLTEVGLIGAVPFIAALLRALWRARRYGRSTGNALPFALMCSLIMINLSLTGQNQKVFWIFLASAVASGLELDSVEQKRPAVGPLDCRPGSVGPGAPSARPLSSRHEQATS
jgi:O-antigen ligase